MHRVVADDALMQTTHTSSTSTSEMVVKTDVTMISTSELRYCEDSDVDTPVAGSSRTPDLSTKQTELMDDWDTDVDSLETDATLVEGRSRTHG